MFDMDLKIRITYCRQYRQPAQYAFILKINCNSSKFHFDSKSLMKPITFQEKGKICDKITAPGISWNVHWDLYQLQLEKTSHAFASALKESVKGQLENCIFTSYPKLIRVIFLCF